MNNWFVFLGGAGEDEDVINVDKDEQHVVENIIHQSLEHGRGVGEAKGHDKILVVATGRVEGGLPLVPPRIRTRWYAFCRSSLEKTVAPWRESKAEEMSGNSSVQ
jgi:hypothetical protein